jgi:hypothetical protein
VIVTISPSFHDEFTGKIGILIKAFVNMEEIHMRTQNIPTI